MKKTIETFESTLQPEAIDVCSERTRTFCESIKLSSRDSMKFAFTVDEILLKTRDALDGAGVKLTTGIKFFRPFMKLEISGLPFNAFANEEESGSTYGNAILRNLGLSPEYSYINGTNTYLFHLKQKSMNPFFKLLIALTLALICSIAGLSMPIEFRAGILDGFLTPIYETFFHILGCIAGPMVFLSVAWGIYGIGDAATLKTIGKKSLGSYIGTVFLIAAAASLIGLPAYSLKLTSSSSGIQGMSELFTMVLNIIPQNIFSPFIDGNTLQVIFLAIVIGIALLFLGQKTTSVARAVEQINYMVQFLVEFICKLVPFFIFVAIVKMLWSDTVSVLKTVGQFFTVFFCCVVVEFLAVVIYTSIKNHISPILIIKKGMPTLLIALTTASSAAAFGTNITACDKSYGIDKKISAFGIPLGMVVFKPTTAISYLAISLFCCNAFNVEISLSWFISMIFTVAVLAIATPPIPGGAITAYTVMFSQLGIPVEGLAIAIACDTIIDFVTTGVDQFLIPLELLNQAGKLGMVDQEILHKS